MGYLILILLFIVVVAVVAMAAFKRPPKKEPEIGPEKEGTSYAEPQDEGKVL